MVDLNENGVAPDFARTKVCGTCRTRKWLLAFYRRKLCKSDGRAAACKDCHREYSRGYVRRHRDRAAHAEHQRDWRVRNRDRDRAHAAVKRAIKAGRILRPKACSDCGCEARLEAHHEDYGRPLDVIWLCSVCHGLRHRNGSRGRKA
ncbi:MAG: hypothetical protein KDK03_01350 [Rhodobacteraceae bacterium]|nr:hypothetical protein [Paracoccaceae bacterium]